MRYRPRGRAERPAVWGLLALHAILAWLVRVPSITTGNDDAWYILLARSIRDGGYSELPFVGTPTHAMYPPGYPALLALLGVTSDAGLPLAIAANIALSVAALSLATRLAQRLSPRLALPTLAVCALNPTLIQLASSVRSEPLYTALALLTLSVLNASADRPPAPRDHPDDPSRNVAGVERPPLVHSVVLAGAAAILAAFARSIGVSLVVAVAAYWALGRHWRPLAAFSVAASLTVGGWLLWTVRAPQLQAGRSYVADAALADPRAIYTRPAPSPTASHTLSADSTRADEGAGTRKAAPSVAPRLPELLLGRVRTNVQAYLTRLIPAALAMPVIPGTRIDNVAWLLLVVVAGTAGGVRMWSRQRATILALLAYAGVLLVWPYDVDRFLAPVIPLIASTLLLGTLWIGERVRHRDAPTAAVATITAALVLGAVAKDVRLIGTASRCARAAPMQSAGCFSPAQRDFFAAASVASRVTPPSATFLVSKEATFFLLTGRQSVPEAEAVAARNPDAFAEFLRERRIQYILLSHLRIQQWVLAAPLEARCRSFELVERFGESTVLLRVPPADERRTSSGAADTAACAAIRSWAETRWEDGNPLFW